MYVRSQRLSSKARSKNIPNFFKNIILRLTVMLFCAYCGKEFSKDRRERDRQVRAGKNRFFCSRACSCAKGNTEHPDKGDASRLSTYKRKKDQHSPFRYYIRKAKSRKKLVNLTFDDLECIWEKQSGKCAYTGIELMLNSGSRQDIRFLASLDRIDSSLPYQLGNVHFVSTAINFAKNDMSHEHFIEFLALIRGHQSSASVSNQPE